MDMIRHDHVGEDKDAVIQSGLSPGIAEYLLEHIFWKIGRRW